MKRSFPTNLLYSILALAGLAILGFMAYVVAAFTGGMLFYGPLALVVASGLAVLSVFSIFGLFSRKVRRMILAAFAGICVLTAAGHEIRQAYVNSLAEVREPEVELFDYAPLRRIPKLLPSITRRPISLRSNCLVWMVQLRCIRCIPLLPRPCIRKVTILPTLRRTGQISLCVPAPPRPTSGSLRDRPISSLLQPLRPPRLRRRSWQAGSLKLTPIGREAFVFFVNKRNPVDSLTVEQIKDIYSGTVTNWKEVGGKKASIRAFQREENSGSQTKLQKSWRTAS